jgi:hypothetical protein
MESIEQSSDSQQPPTDLVTSADAAARKCPECDSLLTRSEITIHSDEGGESTVEGCVCDECGYEEDAANHIDSEADNVRKMSCETCGLQITIAPTSSGHGFTLVAIEKAVDGVTLDSSFGISPNGFPICPKDGVALIPVDAVPFSLAAAAVGDALAGPTQPRLPGTVPPFDIEKAYRTEHKLRQEVREAEREYADKAEKAKDAKKDLERLQSLLGKVMDENERQEREAGLEARGQLAPEQDSVCEYERRTGQACPICRDARRKMKEANKKDVDPKSLEAISIEQHLERRGVFIAADAVTDVELEELKSFAHDEEQKQPPDFVLERAHVAGSLGDESQNCERCGVILMLAGADMPPYQEGAYVRFDCAGDPTAAAQPDEPEPARQLPKRKKAKKAKRA